MRSIEISFGSRPGALGGGERISRTIGMGWGTGNRGPDPGAAPATRA